MYGEDLAHVHASAFGAFAASAAREVVSRLPRGGRVIDIGCGAGVTTRALLDAGFEATGIDVSPALLAIARRAAPEASFVEASAYDAELFPCDVVLAVGEVLGYHPPDADGAARVRGFIAKVARVLGPGGLFAFDLVGTGAPSLDGKGWRSEAGWAVLHETSEGQGRLTRTIETFVRDGSVYRRAREVHHVQLFGEDEVRGWLADSGFEVEIARAYAGEPLLPRRYAVFATRRGR
jgi:SAM-dependent methyltransferase